MEIVNNRNSTHFVFYAYTPYQYYIMSYIVLNIKNRYHDAKCVLIKHKLLNNTLGNFKIDFWDKIVEYNDSIVESFDFWGIKKEGFFKWHKNNSGFFNEIKKVISQLDRVDFFIFSSGDNMIVAAAKQYFPNAVLVNVGEGSASYNERFKLLQNKKTFKNHIKSIAKVCLTKLLGKIYRIKLGNDIFYRPMSGGDDVSFYIDTHMDKVVEFFTRNRVLVNISTVELRGNVNHIINPKVFEMIPAELLSGNAVLLLTDRLSEDGFLNETDEISFFQKLIDIYRKKGYEVFLKPHPRESLDKINIINNADILDNLQGIPIEVLFSVIKVKILTCIGSSAAMNAYDYGVAEKYVMLNNLYFNIIEQKKPLIKKLGDNNGCLDSGDNVYHPNSWDDLISI